MDRKRGISFSFKTSKNTVQKITNTSLPKWSASRVENSPFFKSLYLDISRLESYSNNTDKFENIFKTGGIYEHFIVYRSESSGNYTTTADMIDFFSQKPATYTTPQLITTNDNLIGVTNLSGEDLVDEERFNIGSRLPKRSVYIYLNYNHAFQYISAIETSNNYQEIELINKENTWILLSSNDNITVNPSADYSFEKFSSDNYSRRYDVNNDGFIDLTDLTEYSATHGIPIDEIMFFNNSSRSSGIYVKPNKPSVLVSYISNSFAPLNIDPFVVSSNNEILMAKRLGNGSKLILDATGNLELDGFSLNSLINKDYTITSFDICSDYSIISCLYNGKTKLININMTTLELKELEYTIDNVVTALCILPNDNILYISGNELLMIEPVYQTYYNDGEYFYTFSKNKEDELSLKLDTYPDIVYRTYGYERFFGESLYSFVLRCKTMLVEDQVNILDQFKILLGYNYKNDKKIVKSTYVSGLISQTPLFARLKIDEQEFILRRTGYDYFIGDMKICTYNDKMFHLYDTIRYVLPFYISQYYNVTVIFDRDVIFNSNIYLLFPNEKYYTNVNINRMPETSYLNSKVLIQEYYDSVYKNIYTYGNIILGLSEFDMFRSDLIYDQGYDTVKFNRDHSPNLLSIHSGLFDSISFGDIKSSTVNIVNPNTVGIFSKGDISTEDIFTLSEIAQPGNSQILKIEYNSGTVAENGVLKTYGDFSTDNYGKQYFRKIYLKETLDELGNYITASAKLNTDDNGNMYILDSDISYRKTNTFIYDVSGKMYNFMPKTDLSVGNMYLNLSTVDIYPGSLKLEEKNITVFSNDSSLPMPKSFGITYTNNTNAFNISESLSTTYLKDLHYSYTPIVIETEYNKKLDSIVFTNQQVVDNQITTLYSKENQDIKLRFRDVIVKPQHIKSSIVGISDVYIDKILVDYKKINAKVLNPFSDFILKNSFICEYNLIQTHTEQRPYTYEETIQLIYEITGANYYIVDVILLYDEFYEVKTPPFEYHHKKNFYTGYLDADKESSYLLTNNLLSKQSQAFSDFNRAGLFTVGANYKVIAFLLDAKIFSDPPTWQK